MKCDIRNFFASIDHEILIKILKEYIPDLNIIWLSEEIINSFSSSRVGVGLPLGNLTSQLLVNIYMNEFDQFVKHKLKVRYYIRYADDFIILSENKNQLKHSLLHIRVFLNKELKLELHPGKVSIRTSASGIDFLGWVNFPDHRVLRTATKRRMLKRIKISQTPKMTAFYLGLLKHGNSYKLTKNLKLKDNSL